MADLFIGLMSGTSMDGIDAALVDFTAAIPGIISTHSHRYSDALHQQIEAALQLEDPLNSDLSAIDVAVGEAFAVATRELLSTAGALPEDVTATGSHGQTIRHEPGAAEPYSLQIGNPDVIARHTGIDVVADFRRADIEGQPGNIPAVTGASRAVSLGQLFRA